MSWRKFNSKGENDASRTARISIGFCIVLEGDGVRVPKDTGTKGEKRSTGTLSAKDVKGNLQPYCRCSEETRVGKTVQSKDTCPRSFDRSLLIRITGKVLDLHKSMN